LGDARNDSGPCSVGTGDAVTPKLEVEQLMNEGIGLAETLLARYGEFFPFAVSMHPLGEIRHVNAYDGREQPPAHEVKELLLSALRQLVVTGESKAVAVFVNVTLRDATGEPAGDAVQVGLEHASGYCVDLVFPSTLGTGSAQLGEPFALPRSPLIFPLQAAQA
jgi:hypothetical protein